MVRCCLILLFPVFSDTETQCEVMQEIVDLILEVISWSCSQLWLCFCGWFYCGFPFFQEDFDSEQMSALASCLSELFKDHFRGDVLPEEITEE